MVSDFSTGTLENFPEEGRIKRDRFCVSYLKKFKYKLSYVVELYGAEVKQSLS